MPGGHGGESARRAQLPPHLYSHGSAVLGSRQQVAAAAGTAIVVAVALAVRTPTAPEGAEGAEAQPVH